jgi:Lrp/AsnC family transcriptional regulator for asnA, asnC and gidA
MLDQFDREIIKQLQVDGRKSFTDIARELSVSEGTIRNRVNRLINERVIQIIGMIDPAQLGYEAPAMIGVQVQQPHLEEIARTIADFPEVSYLIMVSGEFDLIVEVLCKDRAALATFLRDKLMRVSGILRAQTFFTLRTFKMAQGAKPVFPSPVETPAVIETGSGNNRNTNLKQSL